MLQIIFLIKIFNFTHSLDFRQCLFNFLVFHFLARFFFINHFISILYYCSFFLINILFEKSDNVISVIAEVQRKKNLVVSDSLFVFR